MGFCFSVVHDSYFHLSSSIIIRGGDELSYHMHRSIAQVFGLHVSAAAYSEKALNVLHVSVVRGKYYSNCLYQKSSPGSCPWLLVICGQEQDVGTEGLLESGGS